MKKAIRSVFVDEVLGIFFMADFFGLDQFSQKKFSHGVGTSQSSILMIYLKWRLRKISPRQPIKAKSMESRIQSTLNSSLILKEMLTNLNVKNLLLWIKTL